MKAVLLNGARPGEKALDPALEAWMKEIAARGADLRVFDLRDMDIAPCTGCFGCWVRTPGVCVIDDAAREIAASVIRSDLLLHLTSVTFGGYSSELKKALDRLIGLILPFFAVINGEVHHRPRYDRYPVLVGLGVLPGPDEESERIFENLIRRNAINLHSPSWGAGTVVASDGPERLRSAVRALLDRAEVKRG